MQNSRKSSLKYEQEGLLRDLAGSGIIVSDVWDFLRMREPYPAALPVLLEHLKRPYSDRLREGIARSLAVPESKVYWDELVDLYKKSTDGRGPVFPNEETVYELGAKIALAVAVAVAYTPARYLEMMSLLRDRSLGPSRSMLLIAFRRTRSEAIKRSLIELLDDPDLSTELRSWKSLITHS